MSDEAEGVELKAGDRVLYVADLGHWHEFDRLNEPVFNFVVARDSASGMGGQRRFKIGEPVDSAIVLKHIDGTAKDPEGFIPLTTGHVVKPSRAKKPWPGVVREEVQPAPHKKAMAVIDGKETEVLIPQEGETVLVLDVLHPNGVVTLHFPLDSLTHDPTGETPHSYHLPEEAKE
jgi:hypothetical protein